MTPSSDYQIQFLLNVQRILKEGVFTSTYKFALLHAIADCCIEKGSDNDEELVVTTQELAIKFIELYWSQSSNFPNGNERDILFQNTGKQAGVINKIHILRAINPKLSVIKSLSEYTKLIKDISTVIKEMPLWRLQKIEGDVFLDFLYPQALKGNTIKLKPGVAYCFRRFYGQVIDMTQGAWIRWVQKTSKNQSILGQNINLEAFLFESKRSNLKLYMPILKEEQNGCCFYCEKNIRGNGEVDHFIPWSRYSVDLGHNFVLAHKACNGDKSDHLASSEFHEKWNERNDASNKMLIEYFDEHHLVHDVDTSNAVANWAYAQCNNTNGLVWNGYKQNLVALCVLNKDAQ